MATNLVVLGENAARINVKVNPNMTVLKVIELACTKIKANSNDFDLKYHNKILDTTSLIRFTNIANNALLELVPVTKSRQNSSVGVWLQIEDGSRLSGEFSSSQNLWEIIQILLKDNFSNYESPAIIYTRMEIIGKEQLQQKTLKDIGLVSGKALLRLLNKKESEDQAHVYVPAARKPKLEESPRVLGHKETNTNELSSVESAKVVATNPQESMDIEPNSDIAEESETINMSTCQKNFDNDPKALDNKKKPTLTNEDLINFKKSISYLDERDTLLFDITDGTSVLYQDEGDDFFKPTIKDITLVLRDLKNSRAQFEDGQLCTSAMRELEKAQNQLNLLHKYKKCIIRIHFPNRLVLQTIFKSTETVLDIINFIRKYLIDESLDFCLFTTPPKTILKPEDTLLESGCVPSAMIHFSCNLEIDQLKPELKHKIVSGCQASIAAYLVRKERISNSSNNETLYDEQPGTSKQLDNQNIKTPVFTQQNKTKANSGKTPKWFKPV
ncbi:tether containing UBX domain for GLUT4 [Metopolophium dirhodum]|uniref:tether containing UBX domain for GLUT4 n=1 Tax=Metopolophium dirhodum TaxID=44670 RepID=UPI00299056F0|nr:tether containing UBX domain for GLUT4 [Metopolophium dirhodum]XP_060867674.1 tether containing UBX domain for GLUT4 [Metopolophium dirhodum]XP_060867675.1 tether containing UBX domain for GLUT4 [Metopolophium dirhodum]